MLNYSVSCQGSMFYAVKVSERRCLFCKKPVMGRADKKFCDSDCRSSHYNQLHRASNNFIRKINRRLTRNRRILKELNPEGKTTVHRNQLVKMKFDFDYYTNVYRTKAGKIYYFCYDQGYLPLDNGFYALVERQEYVI